MSVAAAAAMVIAAMIALVTTVEVLPGLGRVAASTAA